MSSEKKTLVLFDVDGTLTTARQEINPEFKKLLLEKLKGRWLLRFFAAIAFVLKS